MSTTYSSLSIVLCIVCALLLGEASAIANPPQREVSVKSSMDSVHTKRQSVPTIDTSFLPVVFANERTRTRSYANYRGGRPGVRYRYVYPRNYRSYPPRVYYYPPAYRYPAYVYPRTPNMIYYAPTVRVIYGPWFYAY